MKKAYVLHKSLFIKMKDHQKYFQELSREYPTIQSICQEIIHLQSLLNLPKGTEHYISDLHGEYNAFAHLMNNCSGVIKEKAIVIFEKEMSLQDINELCFLIYYPDKVLTQKYLQVWYRDMILKLIRLTRYVTSKYTRSHVRENIKNEYAYIIDELLHAQLDELDQQYVYHLQIIDTIIELDEADHFITILTEMIRFFAIHRLHILGDIYDRGAFPDKIIDDLMNYQRFDLQWGNHDILWLGASLGQPACIMSVVKNCVHYWHIELLEKSYGIPLRKLMVTATNQIDQKSHHQAMEEFCLNMLYKLESQLINTYPEWQMDYRLSKHHDSQLTNQEQAILNDLQKSFMSSQKLQRHMQFLLKHSSLYLKTNHHLLFHGCVPLNDDGKFYHHHCFGQELYGKAYFDEVNLHIQEAYYQHDQESIDYLWYLWCGDYSPLCGRRIVLDQPCEEVKNAYYQYIQSEETCVMLLNEFGLYDQECMIINGHTPVRVKEGESPLKGKGKLIVIDGGFCMQNHRKTGVAGYTLISNSHGMRLKTHHIHLGSYDIHHDMQYDSTIIYTRQKQEMIKDTKDGYQLIERIEDLKTLLSLKRQGFYQ